MIAPLWLSLYQRLKSSIKRSAVYSGTTNGSGLFSVTFATPFSATPHIEPQIIPQSNPNRSCRVTAASAAGFTVIVEERATLTVLSLNVLASAPTPVPSSPVSVIVMEA